MYIISLKKNGLATKKGKLLRKECSNLMVFMNYPHFFIQNKLDFIIQLARNCQQFKLFEILSFLAIDS